MKTIADLLIQTLIDLTTQTMILIYNISNTFFQEVMYGEELHD